MVSKDTKAVKKIIEENLEPEKKKVKKPMKKTEKDIVKSLPKVVPKVILPPKLEFKSVDVVINKSTRFNWIGIFRKLNTVGKTFKIIGSSKSEKEYYKSLWVKYCNWWNNKFNKSPGMWERYCIWWNNKFNTVKAVPVSEELFEDIKIIPRKRNLFNEDDYLEVGYGEKEKH